MHIWQLRGARARLPACRFQSLPVCARVCLCNGGRVGYDLSHCMTPNNKLKPIYEASMRLWLACRGCSVVSAASSLSSPIHQTDAHSGDISVKVIGIKSKLLISPITVTSGRFPSHKDFCG